jgi:hypothetical protein
MDNPEGRREADYIVARSPKPFSAWHPSPRIYHIYLPSPVVYCRCISATDAIFLAVG